MIKRRKSFFTRRRCQSGFSIVEVLVALFVLSIGLLGLAALQAQGLRFNHDAYVRTQATNAAYDKAAHAGNAACAAMHAASISSGVPLAASPTSSSGRAGLYS